MLRVALKSLWGHKFRLVATSLAVIIGVAALAGTLVFTTTMNKTFDDLFATAFEGTDAVVRGQEKLSGSINGQEAPRPEIDESLIGDIQNVSGVKDVVPFIQRYAQVVDKDGKPVTTGGAPTFGNIWSSAPGDPFILVDGTAPRSDDEVVIDRGVAKKTGLKVGDPITVLVAGPTVQARVSGIARFGNADSPGGSTNVLFTENAAQMHIGTPGKLDGITITADDGVSQEQLKERIGATLPAGTEVVTGKEITEELQSQIKSDLGVIGVFLGVFSLIILFVGTFIIYNTFSILVAQRTREHALLRAVGATRRQITRSVLLEAFAVGLIAGGLGFCLGIGLAYGIKALFSAFGADLPADGLVVPSSAVLWSFVVGIVVSMVSAWLPARRASKIPPIAAMRDVAVDHSASSIKRFAAGIVMLALGVAAILVGLFADIDKAYLPVCIGAVVTFLGVATLGPTFADPVSRVLGALPSRFRGVAGRLATDNARRNPKRTAATAAALMIGVGLVGLVFILTSSLKASIGDVLDKSYAGDFVISSENFQSGLPVEIAAEVTNLPEVKAATGMSGSIAEIDGKTTSLIGVDIAQTARLLDPKTISGSFVDVGVDGISVPKKVAEDEGLKVGDSLHARFVDQDDRTYVIRSIHDNDLLDSYVVSKSSLQTGGSAPISDFWVLVAKADGVSAEQARTALDSVVDKFPQADIQDRSEFKQQIAGQIDQILMFFVALLGLAVFIATIGIANALILSVYERTRELGLLRAVGMTRRQLRSCVRWEAVIVSLFGTLLGLLIAVFFGVSLVSSLEDEGVPILRVPMGSLAVITFLGAVVGVIAAVLPARRAARLKVLDAIASE